MTRFLQYIFFSIDFILRFVSIMEIVPSIRDFISSMPGVDNLVLKEPYRILTEDCPLNSRKIMSSLSEKQHVSSL